MSRPLEDFYCPDCLSDDLHVTNNDSLGIDTCIVSCCNGCRSWQEGTQEKLSDVFNVKSLWWLVRVHFVWILVYLAVFYFGLHVLLWWWNNG